VPWMCCQQVSKQAAAQEQQQQLMDQQHRSVAGPAVWQRACWTQPSMVYS
jgi:hypothetical protein